MADSGHAGGHDPRINRHVLPAVAIGRRGVSHPPGRAAVAQDDVANISSADRPGKVGMPSMAKRRAAGLDCIAAPVPSNHSAPTLLTVTRLSGSSPAFFTCSTADRIVRPRRVLVSISSKLISWMLLSLRRVAPPLFPSASGPTSEIQASRTTSRRTVCAD